MINLSDISKIVIVGQGYVGLPLALAFSSHFDVVGYDVNPIRVNELQLGYDKNQELEPKDILSKINPNGFNAKGKYTASCKIEDIDDAQVYIITVPTPIDRYNAPDLSPLFAATKAIAPLLNHNDIIIYESTVYPGCTEEECVPLLEHYSGLTYNKDFFVGYSPERINPGDKVHTLSNTVKVTSGSTDQIAEVIDELYKKIIVAGTYLAKSIKVAEASKAIENAQRDLNISFMNELALLFDKLEIDTQDVLDAASTKYNFLKYKPGLVGGHCISVDPYYLTYKAEQVGYYPQVILSGRRVNNMIPAFVSNKIIKLLLKKSIAIPGAKILVLGATFKENCTDFRNTKVVDIIYELKDFGADVYVFDPWIDKISFFDEYKIQLIESIHDKKFDAILLTVAHSEFININPVSLLQNNGVVFDVKSVWDKKLVDARL